MELFSISSETELLSDCRIFVTSEDEARNVLDYYIELGYTIVPELKTHAYHRKYPYLGIQTIVSDRRITAFATNYGKDWVNYSTWHSLVGQKWEPCCENINSLFEQ